MVNLLSRNLKLFVLRYLGFVPDALMLRVQYFLKLHRWLNLARPQRFTGKLQWYKLNCRDPLMSRCVDKYEVRDFVQERGCGEFLIPLIGLFESVQDIVWDALPRRFVLKTTNGSHTNIICHDKASLDQAAVLLKLDRWCGDWQGVSPGREWPYEGLRPRIVCEELLVDPSNSDLIDYKFVCFDGVVFCVFVNTERSSPAGMTFGIYDADFNLLPYKRKGLRLPPTSFQKPKQFEQMLRIAEVLSAGFPHARIDLYNIEGRIYFGEITFFHGSGYVEFEPDEFDFVLGHKFSLPVAKAV